MSVKLYSLLEYSVSVQFKTQANAINIPLGGMGSYLGSIAVAKESGNITKTVDVTGSGIFSFSANNSGTITVELSYLSVKVQELINRIISRYYAANGTDWKTTLLDIVLYKNNEPIISANDCMLEGLPELTLAAEVGKRTFVFQCIEVIEHTATTALTQAIGAE